MERGVGDQAHDDSDPRRNVSLNRGYDQAAAAAAEGPGYAGYTGPPSRQQQIPQNNPASQMQGFSTQQSAGRHVHLSSIDRRAPSHYHGAQRPPIAHDSRPFGQASGHQRERPIPQSDHYSSQAGGHQRERPIPQSDHYSSQAGGHQRERPIPQSDHYSSQAGGHQRERPIPQSDTYSSRGHPSGAQGIRAGYDPGTAAGRLPGPPSGQNPGHEWSRRDAPAAQGSMGPSRVWNAGPDSGARQGAEGSQDRVYRGDHSSGGQFARGAPYNAQHSRSSGAVYGSGLQPLEIAQQEMTAVLARTQHDYVQEAPRSAAGTEFTLRKRHGTVAIQHVEVTTNFFALSIQQPQLYHYDVSFERVRSSRSQGRGAPSAAEPNPKPPGNAREVMQAFADHFWRDDEGRPLMDAWIFDGGRNLLTAGPVKLRHGLGLPPDIHTLLQLVVQDVPEPGKSRNSSWQLTFQLTRVVTDVDAFNRVPADTKRLLLSGQDASGLQASFSDTRQLLEWILKQVLLSAHEAMEYRRTLYFHEHPGNRNIGGGLRAIMGLSTGIKQGEQQVFLAADVTASTFLRSDINLVEWFADVGGCNDPTGDRGSGRGGWGRGMAGGRGRGRALPEVGRPNVQQLLQVLQRDDKRRWLLGKIDRQLRNKKMLYLDVDGSVIRRCTAVGPGKHPADRSMFFFKFKEPVDGCSGHDMSVADYYAQVLKQPLRFPHLPAMARTVAVADVCTPPYTVVEMKTPKPKEGQQQRQLWLPPERLRFESNQRIQVVTHKGGTEQMIEAARKQPGELVLAVRDPIQAAVNSSSGRKTLQGMKMTVDSTMLRLQARVLPGPHLQYKEGNPGREQCKALNTGVEGKWNMNRYKFYEGAALRDWGLLALLPRREYEASMGQWVLDFIRRCHDLGMDLGIMGRGAPEVAMTLLRDRVMQDMVWLEHGDHTPFQDVEVALAAIRRRSGGDRCQLILCFIGHKPSALYSYIKVASELESAAGGLGLVTQVVVASKTDLAPNRGGGRGGNQRSQYQANVALKVNAKIGGVNTCWAVLGDKLLQSYFNAEVPAIQVFGIDITHPGRAAGARSKAAVVGSLDPTYCKYAQSYWEQEASGSEALDRQSLQTAFRDLILRHYTATGQRPGCLLVYRDGVSDTELQQVRTDEVSAILEACASLSGDYRPRVVFIVVQKRHNVRLVSTTPGAQNLQHGVKNLQPGTVVDHTIVSPCVYDFFLTSHREIPGAGTSRAARYICLVDEMGFGADGLQVFSYWLCYLYCRCTRAVAIVAPVYYAHLLAYRVRVLGEGEGMSFGSGSTGSGHAARQAPRKAQEGHPKEEPMGEGSGAG